jgi:hypothetical protein
VQIEASVRSSAAAHEGPSDPPAAVIEALLRETDAVPEVQNTLRAGIAVELRVAADIQHRGANA